MATKRSGVSATQNRAQRRQRITATGSTRSAKGKNSFRETTEAILIALLAALILRAFVVQAFRIPTGSMKDTLLVGDFLLVNKFVYGVRTPDRIPVIDAQIPFFRLPAFKQPHNGDVVVFKYPLDKSLDYIKRCIGVAGQTIEIRDDEVFINGAPEGRKVDLGRTFDAEDGRHVQLDQITSTFGKKYTIRHYPDDGGPYHLPEIKIPHAGMTIAVNQRTLAQYGALITQYENKNAAIRGGALLIDGKPIPEYTFKSNYYFMMGDNRDNSSDSRVWGMLPESNIVGEALLIYFSWDKASDFWNLLQSVRWSRVANLIR